MIGSIPAPPADLSVEPAVSFLLSGIAAERPEIRPESRLSRGDRRLVIHHADSGFDILEDIDRVTDFALEPNIFFAPRFLIPAMPRLNERDVKLLLLQDGPSDAPETRLVLPYSIEKPGLGGGPEIMRVWATSYGPYGLPVVERRESPTTLEDMIAVLGSDDVDLPNVLVIPDVTMDSAVATQLRGVAIARGLPLATAGKAARPYLKSDKDSVDYFKDTLSGHHRRNFGRLRRQLEAKGELSYEIARAPADVRIAMEEFLLLENGGWKGRQKTSLAADRYRVAFAREAVNLLAERDLCRIHSFKLDGNVIASLIVFVQAGHAWTWKTTYDESFSSFSPGTLLIMQVTETHLDDPNIEMTDSCAIDDHPVMSRLWAERREFTTLVVGLRPDSDRDVRQVAGRLEFYQSTRRAAKTMQKRVKDLIRR